MAESRVDHAPQADVIDDMELARRSLLSWGELLATLARCGMGPDAEVRRPNFVGGRATIVGANPWYNGGSVPVGTTPPADDPLLPHCVWTVADAVPGRVEDTRIAIPLMGLLLDDPSVRLQAGEGVVPEAPPFSVVADMNDSAYGVSRSLSTLIATLDDDRFQPYGLRDPASGRFVCTAMTLTLGDDVGVHYVATDKEFRRRGLATQLVSAILMQMRDKGIRTATLQSTQAGRPLYERLGFRQVGIMRAFMRPAVE
eukprot:jgi/Mesvir1/6867/Mv09036-RA.1